MLGESLKICKVFLDAVRVYVYICVYIPIGGNLTKALNV